ncbi:C-type mannose receptor 2 isoform X1 [Phlebotomus papatasi]|nr:C-type mannose receptor 2 isoform X1 [Phlebotomus papatasi]
MTRLLVLILCISMATTQRNGNNIVKDRGDEENSEIVRQNRITQRIIANFLERRLFPHRRPQQSIPTIDEILPLTTQSPLKIPPKLPSKDEDDSQADDVEQESLQSVESEHWDNFYNDDYFDEDCPNCVDESQLTPNRWTMPLLKLGEKRYYLGVFFRANWFRAAQYCRFHGMHLASIASQEENDKLEKHIRDFGFGNEHFWTSGTDLADEGSFFWMSTGRPITFTNWNAGEPNNFRYENGEEENCLELWNRDGKGLKWNDSPCSFETYFVCEVQ